MTSQTHAAAGSSGPKSAWTNSGPLPSRQVRPDTFTPKSVLESLPGKETDPGRMAIYICLLDDHPHLHPTLTALHKHRLAIHNIRPPPHPETDHPISSTPTLVPDPKDDSVSVPTIIVDGVNHTGTGMEIDHDESIEKRLGAKPEWLMWKLSDEESLRRKAYLPLA